MNSITEEDGQPTLLHQRPQLSLDTCPWVTESVANHSHDAVVFDQAIDCPTTLDILVKPEPDLSVEFTWTTTGDSRRVHPPFGRTPNPPVSSVSSIHNMAPCRRVHNNESSFSFSTLFHSPILTHPPLSPPDSSSLLPLAGHSQLERRIAEECQSVTGSVQLDRRNEVTEEHLHQAPPPSPVDDCRQMSSSASNSIHCGGNRRLNETTKSTAATAAAVNLKFPFCGFKEWSLMPYSSVCTGFSAFQYPPGGAEAGHSGNKATGDISPVGGFYTSTSILPAYKSSAHRVEYSQIQSSTTPSASISSMRDTRTMLTVGENENRKSSHPGKCL